MMKGPWKYRQSEAKGKSQRGFSILDERGNLVCRNDPTKEPLQPAVKAATGQLIKAAPDLLHAIKEILKSGLNQATLQTAIAAVKRAEGPD